MAADKTNSGRTALIYDPKYRDHETGRGHPECPERLDAVIRALESAGLESLKRLKPRSCPDETLRLCHGEDYLKTVQRDVAAGLKQLSTGDTAICSATLEVARLAAGGVLSAVDAVMTGEAERVFCGSRPPGHHACPNRGMGFCVFSNVAVAARYAQRHHGIGKVLIADWDVHHGNGTQEVFYEDDSVFFFSTHQSPWYPGTGAKDETGMGKGLGSTLNQPFGAGAGRKEIIGAFTDKLLPAAARFKPELIFISAGFDSRLGDPLGEFRLIDEDFAELTRIMSRLAGEYAGGKLVSVLEGGYHLDGLAAATRAHVQTLAGTES